jgi:exopolysaccharide biosynthesis polyprenyl glycosylphosphotransferase
MPQSSKFDDNCASLGQKASHTVRPENSVQADLAPTQVEFRGLPIAPGPELGTMSPRVARQEAVVEAGELRRRSTQSLADEQKARHHLLDARVWRQLRLIVDIVVLYVAAGAAFYADARSRTTASVWLVALFPPVVVVLMNARRPSDDRFKGSLLDAYAQVVSVVSLAAMLFIASASILSDDRPLGLAVRLWLYAAVYLGISRAVLLSARRRAIRSAAFAVPTLVVGAGVVGAQLVRRLIGDPGYGLRPVGLVDADPLPDPKHFEGPPVPVLGGLESLTEAIRTTGARHVILAFSSEPDHVLAAKVRECQSLGIAVSLVPRLYESINERTTLDHVGGLPLLTLHVVDPRGWQFAVKHAIDRSFALVGLLVTVPAMIAISVAIKRSSPGPILFRQRRVGRDGHEFDLLKFRTMLQPDADGRPSPFELPDDLAPGGVEGRDRRTGLGRMLRGLSLDELPQLINVVRGDMSLVGPRPERPEYVARFAREVVGYEDRHRVRSGITGWAQVHGLRGQTSISDRVEWDNYYILNWSLRLDFRILALTLVEILRFREDG